MHSTHSEIRVVIKFMCKQKRSASEILTDLRGVYGNSIKRSTVYRWVKLFSEGRDSVEDDPRSGRPTVINNAVIQSVRDLIEADKRITYSRLISLTGYSSWTLQAVIHDHLRLRKLTARWVPHKLTPENKQERVDCCNELLRSSCRRMLSRIVTCDETWLYFYDPETKEQSKQWTGKDETSPQKFVRQKTSKKVMWIVFWDSQGIVLSHVVPQHLTVNAEYYRGVLERQLLPALEERRPGLKGKSVLFQQDNAPPHRAAITQETLAELGWTILRHPVYSPDLAPSDFHLFPALKRDLKGRTFLSRAGLASAVYQWCLKKTAEGFFADAFFNKLPVRWRKCVDCNGDYFEK